MTAAIRPACCAGADDGWPDREFVYCGRVDRGGGAVADIDADIVSLGAAAHQWQLRRGMPLQSGDRSIRLAIADADLFAVTDAKSLLISITEPVADAGHRRRNTNSNPHSDINANIEPND